MDSRDIIATLRANEEALRSRGIRHAALFGSVARGTAGPESDIDIMIEIDPEAIQDIYAYVGLKNFVADLFTGRVDVIDRAALKPHVRPPAEADAVYAF